MKEVKFFGSPNNWTIHLCIEEDPGEIDWREDGYMIDIAAIDEANLDIIAAVDEVNLDIDELFIREETIYVSIKEKDLKELQN